MPDALSVSALPQKTRISWLSEALWGNDYFVFDVRRRAVPNLQSSACMVPDSVLTLAIPTSRAMRLFGAFIAAVLQSVRAFRVSGGDMS